jgi:hypothetical protein
VKLIEPTRMLAEAADVLAEMYDDVVVVGAAALEVALAEQTQVAITPTRDVDVVVPVEHAAAVVARLEAADLRRSKVPHERAFTWVRGDLKVQLVRTFHPFPKPPATALPVNNVFGMASDRERQEVVAFADDPTLARLRCANSACLVALKQAAFGRTRPETDRVVERDYHDVHLLFSAARKDVIAGYECANFDVRTRIVTAAQELASGGDATMRAATEMVNLRDAPSRRVAEASVRRAATEVLRVLRKDP